MKAIILISPLDAIEVFKQLGFDTLVSDRKKEIENYVRTNIANAKVIVYDISLKEIMNPLKEEFKTADFPIFMALAFSEDQTYESLMDTNRQIENAVGIKIE